MKLFCILALSAAALHAADNQLTPAEKSAGWKLLFDGSSYANWEDPARKSPPGDSFSIEDGCLKATPHPRINEDLFTIATFRNFELAFDWKISPGGNSGVKYRIQDRIMLAADRAAKFEDLVALSYRNRRTDRPAKGQEYVVGFEYQITDNATNPDASTNGAKQQTAALYDMIAPARDATRPVGEFNQSRILVTGDHIEHWLNGVKVVDGSLKAPEIAAGVAKRWGETAAVYDLLVKQPRQSCQISLQNHNDAAWFKNIKVREIR